MDFAAPKRIRRLAIAVYAFIALSTTAIAQPAEFVRVTRSGESAT
jgi:hypothetical protein